MRREGFGPTIPVFERKTVHALDRVATVIGLKEYLVFYGTQIFIIDPIIGLCPEPDESGPRPLFLHLRV
jgi:hypothetical protein